MCAVAELRKNTASTTIRTRTRTPLIPQISIRLVLRSASLCEEDSVTCAWRPDIGLVIICVFSNSSSANTDKLSASSVCVPTSIGEATVVGASDAAGAAEAGKLAGAAARGAVAVSLSLLGEVIAIVGIWSAG